MLEEIKRKILIRPQTVRGTIFKNFLWLFVGSTGGRLLKAVIVIYAARQLGVAGYGIFSYALGLAGFFTFLKNIGVDGILTREIAKQPEKEKEYLSTSFFMEIFLLAATFLLVFFIAPFFSGVKEAVPLLFFAALILIFDDLRDLFVAFFRGREKMELESLVVVIGNFAMLAFGFFALYIRPTPRFFAAATAAASLAGLFFSWLLLRRLIRNWQNHFKKDLIVPILKSAWPFAVSGFAGLFLFNIDIVMLGWWFGPSEVGIFSAAQRIIGLLSVFGSFLTIAIFPVLSRLAFADSQKLSLLLENSFKMIFLVSFPLIVGGVILRHSIMDIVFGADYAAGAGVLAILIFSLPTIYALAVFSNLLFAFDKQSKTIVFSLVSSVSNLILNFILIRHYGMIGAALATVISFSLYTFLLWRTSRQFCSFRIFAGALKPLAVALAMGLLVFIMQFFGWSAILSIAVGAFFYVGFLYFLKDEALREILSFLRSGFGKLI